MTEFVSSYFDAWNHRDPKAVADHLARDGVYCDVPENVRQTHDELIVSLTEFFAIYRHRYSLVGEILAGNNTISFQYRMHSRGQAADPAGGDSFNGAEFITLDGDAAVTIYDYYEIPGLSRRSALARSRVGRPHKYAKSGLDARQLLRYKTRLERIVRSRQIYLQSDLTLPKLARAVNCSVNHLSQVINAGFGMSFFSYLNRYRIEHAKSLLSSVDAGSNVVLNIAYTVGFNSNSAFYAAFRKFVGQTPAQFRRSQLK